MSEILTIHDEADCKKLWNEQSLGSLGYGITGNFDFRRFYSELFHQHPMFLTDNIVDPTFIIPLGQGSEGVDWFGTAELEDTPFYCIPEGINSFKEALTTFAAPKDLHKVNEKQLMVLENLALIDNSQPSGIKVVATQSGVFDGNAHWSRRNLERARKAFEQFEVSWNFIEFPNPEQLVQVFDDSVAMFTQRNQESKLADVRRRQKYIDIYTAQIPGIRSYIAECSLDGKLALEALFITCEQTATVSTVAVSTTHPNRDKIVQYGFRYAIISLRDVLVSEWGCQQIDYQGGNHSWKQQVNQDYQVSQSLVTFHGNI